jgi:YfiR/HmsC-like
MLALGLLILLPGARADDLSEYRLKAAFLYNFIAYTDWPTATGNTLTLCVHGSDPFGKEIDGLQGKVAGGRTISVQRRAAGDPLKGCQVLFFSASIIDSLPRLVDSLHGQAVLTVADSSGAMHQGAILNMNVAQGKVTFEANLMAARSVGLGLSSKLLRLAKEVKR